MQIPPFGFYPFLLSDGKTWRWCFVGRLRWELGMRGSGLWVEAEEGSITDLASIPKWLHWLVNPYAPETAEAAGKHDELLRRGFEQRMAAGEFYRALRDSGFPRWKCVGFYLAVMAASDCW